MQETDIQKVALDIEQPSQANLPAERPQYAAAPVVQTTPMDLLRIVTERGASVQEISAFMDLMERQEAKVARQAFVRAMAEFKKNPPDIYKNKRVEHSGISYDHATLGNICEQIIGALAEHGISHKWTIEQPGTGMIRVTCTLTHDMGHSETTSMEAPADNSGKKNPIQSIASAVTYLERYTLLAATGIAVKEQGDDDGRGAGEAKESAPKQKSTLGTKGFAAAMDAVRTKSYDADALRANYALTTEQEFELAKVEKEIAQ